MNAYAKAIQYLHQLTKDYQGQVQLGNVSNLLCLKHPKLVRRLKTVDYQELVFTFAACHPAAFTRCYEALGGVDWKLIQSMFERDGKIRAIKLYREMTGKGLADSKVAVEKAAARYGWKLPRPLLA